MYIHRVSIKIKFPKENQGRRFISSESPSYFRPNATGSPRSCRPSAPDPDDPDEQIAGRTSKMP